MANLPVVIILVAETLCVNSHTVTFLYTSTQTRMVKSGSAESPHHSSSLVGCAVRSTLRRSADHCFSFDVTSGACNIAPLPSLCSYRRVLAKPPKTSKKILFMMCKNGRLCKFTFVSGPGIVHTTQIDTYAISYKVYEVHYHQTTNTVYWTRSLYAKYISSTKVNSEKGKKFYQWKLPFRTITFDIDSSINRVFILSDKALHRCNASKCESEELVRGEFTRSSHLYLDKFNRRVFYTCACTRRSSQDMMYVSYDGKFSTRIAQFSIRVKTFVVDDKGWGVFICRRYLSMYNVNTTETSRLGGTRCSGMTTDGQEMYIPAVRKILVVSMDSGTHISTLQIKTNRRNPETYLPEIHSDPN